MNWKPHSKIHIFVSDETHIKIKITMLIMKRMGIIRDLAHVISSYVVYEKTKIKKKHLI